VSPITDYAMMIAMIDDCPMIARLRDCDCDWPMGGHDVAEALREIRSPLARDRQRTPQERDFLLTESEIVAIHIPIDGISFPLGA
jgi:hypothetical protein